MIFVTLPVRDLAGARASYEALGFRYNQCSVEEPMISFADPEGHVWQLMWMEPVHPID